MKKIKKHFKKHWQVHACWLVIVAMGVSILAMKDLSEENEALRMALKDEIQVRKQAEHSFEVLRDNARCGYVTLKYDDLPVCGERPK